MIGIFVCIGIFGGPVLWKQTSKEQDILVTEEKRSKNPEVLNDRQIRVLISNQVLGIYQHKKVSITSDEDYYIIEGTNTKRKKAGQTTTLFFHKKEQGRKVVFTGVGKLKLKSVKRADGIPSYRGKLEVCYGKNGCTIVNEVSLEEYLYAVLPSEMPTSYGIEALKVQAVCARSFAIRQMRGKKFQKYDANVDDSVASQVYHNSDECKESIQAVKKTSGEVLTFQGEVIPAYFFSTSWGYTADSHDVWIRSGKSPVYLCGKLQKKEGGNPDLSTNKSLLAFLREKQKTYDSEFPWYRWSVKISTDQMIDSNIGKVRKIETIDRGKSGIVKKIRITGRRGVKVIEGEYRIRKFFGEGNLKIKRNDGSFASSNFLPSGCFYLRQSGKNLFLYGGGYGHGVGMSQNGTKKQAELGRDYQTILKYYYPESEITTLP